MSLCNGNNSRVGFRKNHSRRNNQKFGLSEGNSMIGQAGNTKVSLYIDLLFDWFEISCMTTDNFCFYLQYRLIQTSQTGGQWYSDTSPFSFPWVRCQIHQHLISSFCAKILSPKNYKPKLNTHKRCAKNFRTKNLLVKYW
jgi:hypothetical protein